MGHDRLGGRMFMQTVLRAIDKGIDGVLSVTGRVSSVLMVLIAFFVFANVVSRFAGFPLPWLFDVTCFCLIIFTYLGAAYGLREGAQINVDILRNHLPEETNAFLDGFIYILSAGFFCIWGWTGWDWAHDSYVYGLRTTTAIIKFPKWIIISFIPLGSFFLLLQCIRLVISNIHRLLKVVSQGSSARLVYRLFMVSCLLFLALVLGTILLIYVHPLVGMFFFLLIFLFAGMPVAFALGTMGCLGIYFLFGASQFTQLPMTALQAVNSWPLTAIPLFVLGGMLMGESAAAKRIFEVVELWFRRIPSPLVVATILSAGIFCAITGSSVAATATIGTTCLPILYARGYNKRLCIGAVAGATVGTLIPPSNGFILYGVIVDESVGQLFMAGVMPAVVLFALYISYVCVRTLVMKGERVEVLPPTTWKTKFGSLRSAFWGLLAPFIVLGGIYLGLVTPTEAGGILVVYALTVGVFFTKTLKWQQIKTSALGTIGISLMVLSIISFASIYSSFIAQHQIMKDLVAAVKAFNLSAGGFLVILCLILLFLGMFLEAVAIMMLTLPLIYPIAMALGINSLWLGVFYIINTEIGLMTPPVGLELFILKGIVKEDMATIARSTIPFIFMMLLTLLIMYLWPQLATWLPRTMF
jgi:C4-dicarboxylate transporter DctM subunit